MTIEDEAKPPTKPNPGVDDPFRYPGDDSYALLPTSAPERTMEETFFYYVGNGKGGTARTLVYRVAGDELPCNDQINAWVADARSGGAGAFSRDFDSFGWHKPCFLMFFTDLPGWTLLEEEVATGGQTNRALWFAQIPAGSAAPKTQGNASFFNARTQTVPVGGVDCQVLVVQNYHLKAPAQGGKKYQPRVEGDPADYYKFDIYLGQEIEGAGGKMLYYVLDPGGKNAGPP